jgi:ketosteroid isomerase-like protein
MASPAEVFEALREAHARADAEAAAALYAPDAVYYEPDNVPHRGRGPGELTVKRQVHADQTVLTEWTSAFTDGGRRSTGVPGVSVIELGRDGIVYHRDFG